MKKFLATGIGVLFIFCILIFASYSNNSVRAGNEITEFEYEYYYNDNMTGGSDMETGQGTAAKTGNGKADSAKGSSKDSSKSGTKDSSKSGAKDSSKNGVKDSSKSGAKDSSKNGAKDSSKNGAKDSSKNGAKDSSKSGANDSSKDTRTGSSDEKKRMDIDPESLYVFVNKEYALPEYYIPDNLVVPNVKFYGGGNNEKNKLRQEAAEALEEMFSAAMDDDIVLYGVSGYRSYARQKEIYDKNVRMRGSKATDKVSAAPGHSEHQTGLAIDISSKSLYGALTEKFGSTPEGEWVAKNSYKYGFIIRYPENTEQITGYSYEPWHIRYIGQEIAEHIYSENITLEEYYGYTLDEYYLDNIISDSGMNE